jgi:hypothetical protein
VSLTAGGGSGGDRQQRIGAHGACVLALVPPSMATASRPQPIACASLSHLVTALTHLEGHQFPRHGVARTLEAACAAAAKSVSEVGLPSPELQIGALRHSGSQSQALAATNCICI